MIESNETVTMTYVFEDEFNERRIDIGSGEVQMEMLADQFVDFAASVFGFGRDWVIRRTIEHLSLETPKFDASELGFDAGIESTKEKYAALKVAAWDVHEIIGDALDGEADFDDIRRAWNELGELLPAQRPE
jgi:hypothetical protein